jgi:hypothetical protein
MFAAQNCQSSGDARQTHAGSARRSGFSGQRQVYVVDIKRRWLPFRVPPRRKGSRQSIAVTAPAGLCTRAVLSGLLCQGDSALENSIREGFLRTIARLG